MPKYRADFTPAEKKEFGRRLTSAMRELGWNGSELARRATDQLPPEAGLEISRDHVSRYLSGATVPQPLYLEALANALRKLPLDLLPRAHDERPKATPPGVVAIRRLSTDLQQDGLTAILVDATLPDDVVSKITELVRAARPPLKSGRAGDGGAQAALEFSSISESTSRAD